MHEETISTCTPGPGRPVLDFTLTDTTTTTTGNLNFTINSLFNAAFNRKTQRQGPQVHTIVPGREDAPFPALQSSTLQPPHFGCQTIAQGVLVRQWRRAQDMALCTTDAGNILQLGISVATHTSGGRQDLAVEAANHDLKPPTVEFLEDPAFVWLRGLFSPILLLSVRLRRRPARFLPDLLPWDKRFPLHAKHTDTRDRHAPAHKKHAHAHTHTSTRTGTGAHARTHARAHASVILLWCTAHDGATVCPWCAAVVKETAAIMCP